MTELEQDYMIELARSRDFQDRLIERERLLRSDATKLELIEKNIRKMLIDIQNISELCAQISDVCSNTPLNEAEVRRRALAIKKIADGYLLT